ncbi:L,D-transpeptidase family protein [Rhizobiaceae bacterium BDR2-2]|uniref:L,D-transpeptidase family protein n=1 Tax=Ectorhizobium quercum TaxID=2965071 RepID=A0AAE3N189_9HYPH|nr:L,D-transpeptidase family protein [Ectorhizobium quercum]MCX8998908.1 L,D-transpeptidase family protein [Ectorhizobium quercum]
MVSRFVFCLAFLPAAALAPFAQAGDGILQIVISKTDQSLAVYRDGAEIASSKVSTGKAGHATPTGIFSILEKRKYHESNLYSNAPMPFMQRLTWSGIALHEGHVPAYPASHGCIRLPGPFARSLYGMTQRGVHVIVSEAPVVPVRIVHESLFQPRGDDADRLLLTDTPLRPARSLAGDRPVEVAMNEASALPADGASAKPQADMPPLRILVTRRGDRERILDMQTLLNRLGFDAGTPDGIAGRATVGAITAFRIAHDLPESKAVLDPAFLAALYEAAGTAEPPAGHLLVRRDFKPLFEAPIGIRDPERELGTHFLVATDVDPALGHTEWTAMSLENRLADATAKRLGITERLGRHEAGSASDALSRLDIPPDVRERIERLLGAGSSITVTDNGISTETGQGTDFITLTRAAPPEKKS